MRFVEKQEKETSKLFEDVSEVMEITLKEAVKVVSADGEEFLLEKGDALRVTPKK